MTDTPTPTPDDPHDALRTAGVAAADIADLEQRVEQTVDAMLDTHADHLSLDTDEEAAVVVAVQDELLRYLVATGWRDADRDVPTWFDRIDDEFADPGSHAARSNVGVVVGLLAGRVDDTPRAVMKLANATLAEKYDR